jgi:3-hydroxyisobutyrate dehydrogenase
MRVAVLGLGAMGARMGLSLLNAGHDVRGWNRSSDATSHLASKGATICATPCEAASIAEVVIACVRDDAASQSVWLDSKKGALAGMQPGAVAIESSTLSVAWALNLAHRASECEVDFLDAPVLGSRPQAEAGTLIHLVGGNRSVLARAHPVLSAIGGAVHWMGPAGAGAAMKLMVNAMLAIQTAALGELFAAMKQYGLPEDRVAAVFSEMPVCSPAAKAAAESMVHRSFSPLFPVELMEKDLSYLVSAAVGDTPVTHGAHEVFARAIRDGLGHLNQTAVFNLYNDISPEGLLK